MIIFWILAILVTNLATATIITARKNRTKKDAVEETDFTSWHSGFKAGWESVLADYGTMKSAIRKLETDPMR